MRTLFKRHPDWYAGSDFLNGVPSKDDDGGGSAQNGGNYSNIVLNVGRKDMEPPVATSNGDVGGDGGVHIQASFDNKKGGNTKKKPVYLTAL